jgi:heme-degrading monooxygenase HmoA
MFKWIVHQSRTWMLVSLFTLFSLSFWVLFSQPAQAGKTMKSLVFDGSSSTVEVATIYETSYAAQKGVMKSLKVSSKLMKKAPGFKGFFMLQNQNGKEVITVSQWQDLASYQAYTPTPLAASEATSSVAAPPAPTRSLVFEVAGIQPSIPGTTPALRGKEAVVQVAQFTARQPEAQAQVLTQVKEMIPALLEKQPIPQSALLLKGLDNGEVALLTNWNCSALFEDVGKPATIEPNNDLIALADSEQQFYNVVTIIPAEVKKAKDKSDKLDD